MLFLSRVLYFCTFFIGFLLFNSLTKANAQGFPIPVLMYHYIREYHFSKDPTGNQLSVSPNSFDQQMQYLVSHGYTPISLDTMYGILSGKASVAGKPIVLTFDDGYIDFYANAYPILKKYGFHAVSFVPTRFVGRPEYVSME
jgi:peptidoglycan/xylan/chitin deacetylase (PgdA/CDA1 family)